MPKSKTQNKAVLAESTPVSMNYVSTVECVNVGSWIKMFSMTWVFYLGKALESQMSRCKCLSLLKVLLMLKGSVVWFTSPRRPSVCCPAHQFSLSHTLWCLPWEQKMGLVIKGGVCVYVCVCESACRAHTDCVGLYLLNMRARWTIVKLSCMVHTEHTPL